MGDIFLLQLIRMKVIDFTVFFLSYAETINIKTPYSVCVYDAIKCLVNIRSSALIVWPPTHSLYLHSSIYLAMPYQEMEISQNIVSSNLFPWWANPSEILQKAVILPCIVQNWTPRGILREVWLKLIMA